MLRSRCPTLLSRALFSTEIMSGLPPRIAVYLRGLRACEFFKRRHGLTLLLAAACLLTNLSGNSARSQVIDDFESGTISWKIAGGDCRPLRVEVHQRTAQRAKRGNRCEHLRIRAGSGTHVYVTHEIEPATVIDELRPSVWIRSDRMGIQIIARVVLPRSQDPRSGRPVSTLIRGSSYTQTSAWQRLRINNLQSLLDRQVPVLRAQFGSHIDPREAFVDRIILNVYGGLGVTNVWIDDLETESHVTATQSKSAVRDSTSLAGSASLPGARARAETAPASSGTNKVRVQGSILTVDGQPYFPRAFEHHGERLSQIAKLGFNTVKLTTPPTPDQLLQAHEHGLLLIAPARDLHSVVGGDARQSQVLAWNLGDALGPHELDSVRTRAAAIRQASSDPRPLICSADSALFAYSRHVDFLLHERLPMGTSFELADFGPWLIQRSRMCRPGTPFWATVQTELTGVLPQSAAMSGWDFPLPRSVEPEQIRLLTYLAITAGARGICFQSSSSLDDNHAQARLRSLTLQSLNRELALIEPWIAGGVNVGSVDASDPEVIAVALATDRSRLVISIRRATGAQYVAGATPGKPCSLTVPGVPESSNAFEITTTGLKPLRHRRVAGGMRLMVDKLSSVSLLVLTQNPLVIRNLSHKIGSIGQADRQLQRSLAAVSLSLVEDTERRLELVAPVEPRTSALLQEARAGLRQSERLLATGDATTADHYARRCLGALSQLRRSRWEQAVRGLSAPVSSPFCLHYATLPMHWQLLRQASTATAGANIMPGGDFEDLEQMIRSGWRHFQQSPNGIKSDVSLTSSAPREGRHALRIRAVRVEVNARGSAVETTPVWINSATTPISAGQLIRIHLWVRIDNPIVDSLDGLMIFDSLGGPLLAQRIRQTNGWQDVTLFRKATRPHPLIVTFALTGIGDVAIDELVVQPLGSPRATISSPPSQTAVGRQPSRN